MKIQWAHLKIQGIQMKQMHVHILHQDDRLLAVDTSKKVLLFPSLMHAIAEVIHQD